MAIPPLPQRDHLRNVLRALLLPLARLALAHGVKYQDLSDVLKLAFMDAGKETLSRAKQRINASTLSVTTGLHRKDLASFLAQADPHIEAEPPLEARIFARWTTDPRYLDAEGLPISLERGSADDLSSAGPTFEKLARSITTDVRPRAVLESMLRLDLVHQPDEMHVALVNHELVPSKAIHQMLELLRDNARDHLNAAVANTMGHDPRFLEQSIFASGLSEESAKTLHQLVRKRWLSLTQGLVPQIQKAIDEDRPSLQVVPSASQRIRIGMYFYNEAQHKDKK